jgi:peroxiredoxin 5
MKAWAKSLDKDASSKIRFLGDPSGAFTRGLDTQFEAAPMLSTNRSKWYVIKVRDGKVQSVDVAPDNVGASVSAAGKVLG